MIKHLDIRVSTPKVEGISRGYAWVTAYTFIDGEENSAVGSEFFEEDFEISDAIQKAQDKAVQSLIARFNEKTDFLMS